MLFKAREDVMAAGSVIVIHTCRVTVEAGPVALEVPGFGSFRPFAVTRWDAQVPGCWPADALPTTHHSMTKQ